LGIGGSRRIDDDMQAPTAATGGGVMTAAQFQTLEPASADELLRARFEALAEWGIPLADAHTIAQSVTVDVVEAVELLCRGCPAHLVLPILG
jgi:hypothetical protein